MRASTFFVAVSFAFAACATNTETAEPLAKRLGGSSDCAPQTGLINAAIANQYNCNSNNNNGDQPGGNKGYQPWNNNNNGPGCAPQSNALINAAVLSTYNCWEESFLALRLISHHQSFISVSPDNYVYTSVMDPHFSYLLGSLEHGLE